jgi:hypothetical protein
MYEAVVKAMTSTECLAAFLGAFAAFLLEALRRWRSDRLAQLAAGNEAMFALSQMYTYVVNVRDQLFIDRETELLPILGRQPHYFEYLPIEIAPEDVGRIKLDTIAYLFRSHDPDLLNRLAGGDREFSMMMKTIIQRNAAQYEFQRRTTEIELQLKQAGAPLTIPNVEHAMGADRVATLKHLTAVLKEGLPRCGEDLVVLMKQLHDVLSLQFPTQPVTGFDPVSRPHGVSEPPKEAKAPRWRLIVRVLYRLVSRPERILAWHRAKKAD